MSGSLAQFLTQAQAAPAQVPLASMMKMPSVANSLVPPDQRLTLADAYSYNKPIVQDAIAGAIKAAQDPQTWLDAAHQWGQAMIAGTGAPGIRAFHGSPHSFDKFDLGKIGTGEGAQAYGHGLYFAGNEGVARSYRDTLAGDGFLAGDGQIFNPATLQHMNVRSTLNRTGDIDAALTRAKGLLPGNEQTAPMLAKDIETLETLKTGGGLKPNPGHMYEVNLAVNPDHMLDWDKPRDQLAPNIQQFAQKAAPEAWENAADGASLYRLMAKQYGSHDALSGAMSQAGIPGIRYLDQGSRAAGEGSRNYVMFDPANIQIVRKYAVPLTALSTQTPGLFADNDLQQ